MFVQIRLIWYILAWTTISEDSPFENGLSGCIVGAILWWWIWWWWWWCIIGWGIGAGENDWICGCENAGIEFKWGRWWWWWWCIFGSDGLNVGIFENELEIGCGCGLLDGAKIELKIINVVLFFFFKTLKKIAIYV